VLKHIKDIRYWFLDPRYRTKENKNRHNWYVNSLLNKFVLLPTGEVTLIERGNPSGQISTTSDNIMVNTFLSAFEYKYQAIRENRLVFPEQYFQEHRDICYGDDRLSGIYGYLPDKDMLIDMYAKVFGMWVKPEKFILHKGIAGSSFCGFTFKKNKQGYWVGEVNTDKLLSTLKEPIKSLPDIEALWAKLISLRLLSEYSGKETKQLLDKSIARVEDAMLAEGIEPVKLPRHFYKQLW
ncbi:RNA-dependent RNA polymerase, partial [Astroviridae sp.]